MVRARVPAAIGSILMLVFHAAGCSSSDAAVMCGQGTVLAGDTCVAVADGGAASFDLTFGGVAAVAPVSASSLFVAWEDARSSATPPERMRYAVNGGFRPLIEN